MVYFWVREIAQDGKIVSRDKGGCDSMVSPKRQQSKGKMSVARIGGGTEGGKAAVRRWLI